MPETTRQTPWLAEGDEKRERVRAMFSDIAPTYDLVNSVVSFRLHYRWRRVAVASLDLSPGDRVLDVCCGTGDFFRPLLQAVGEKGRVVGVDFCRPMLDGAETKFGHQVQLIEGDACRLPFRDGQFEAVTVGWGLRNVPDYDQAVREIARVLRPGGRFVSLDMARPRGAVVGRVSEAVLHGVVPAVGRLVGKSVAYQYLPKSTLKYRSREEQVEALQAAGFRDVSWRDLFFGNICLHRGVKA